MWNCYVTEYLSNLKCHPTQTFIVIILHRLQKKVANSEKPDKGKLQV
jgi:hypothetical protein